MAENVVFLEPGDERAQKIAKAMGSQTASDILQSLGEHPKSLTAITGQLAIPMNTAKYHIENLLEAGLIAVSETKYSVKGREVKLYTLTNQLLIVAPKQSAVRSILLKYASLFGIVAFCSIVVSILSTAAGPGLLMSNSLGAEQRAAAPETAAGAAKSIAEVAVTNATPTADHLLYGTKGFCETAVANLTTLPPVPSPATTANAAVWASSPAPAVDPAVAFFLGGVLVIAILVCYELWQRNRK
jgi:DNA-binding transcriptional ArsR family regulator